MPEHARFCGQCGKPLPAPLRRLSATEADFRCGMAVVIFAFLAAIAVLIGIYLPMAARARWDAVPGGEGEAIYQAEFARQKALAAARPRQHFTYVPNPANVILPCGHEQTGVLYVAGGNSVWCQYGHRFLVMGPGDYRPAY